MCKHLHMQKTTVAKTVDSKFPDNMFIISYCTCTKEGVTSMGKPSISRLKLVLDSTQKHIF